MSRIRTTTASAVVGVLAAISAGSWGLAQWRPFENETASIEWPDNVRPIVDYVEDESNLRFLSTIDFEYIEQVDEYNDRARDPEQAVSADEAVSAAIDDAVGRALGFWAGDASILASASAVNRSTPRPVRWLPDAELVLIHGRRDDATLAPAVRADLVVYLAQALIEQHFHLIERRRASDDAQEYEALAALHIGYALWLQARYLDDLSDDERADYEVDSGARAQEYAEEVDSIPATYRAIRIAFQLLGPTFVSALAKGDETLLRDALSTRSPVALDQISLPTAKYLRRDAPESVRAPKGPLAATVYYSDQLGPFRLFLMFATGLPANEALTASDGWGNDRFTVYELDGRVCTDVHLVADSPVDADRMERALNGWALARPSTAAVLVGRDGVHLYSSVCDPGTDAQQVTPADASIEQYFGRADLLRQQTEETGKPALAECIATEFFAQFTFEQFTIEAMARELDAGFATIRDECRSSV